MKINIAVIGPEDGIGGTNRKYKIYFKYLDEHKFNKFYINLSKTKDKIEKMGNGEYLISENKIISFLDKNKINYVYLSLGNYSKETYNLIKENRFILKNINFTELYDPDPKVLNLIISKTDHLKIKLINKTLINDYVVYNPIDFELWTKLSKDKKNNFRNFFRDKKIRYVVGRLARAEPSKWEFLIIKTLLKLQKEKNYDYGFVLAGTSSIYRWSLKLVLNRKMRNNILFLPELKAHEDLAKFYNSIDLFWQTSHIGESFGNVIAESFCFEVPVITDFKKFLQDDGSVAKEKYDAQIEVVDHGKNGAYCNYPAQIIDFLKNNNKLTLRKLGKNGYAKVKSIYDARIAGDTLARILYDHLRANSEIKKDAEFEKLKRIPSKNEIDSYYSEYVQRLNTAVKNNRMEKRQLRIYLAEKKVWTFLENIYLAVRKLLRYVKIDLEKFNPKIK